MQQRADSSSSKRSATLAPPPTACACTPSAALPTLPRKRPALQFCSSASTTGGERRCTTNFQKRALVIEQRRFLSSVHKSLIEDFSSANAQTPQPNRMPLHGVPIAPRLHLAKGSKRLCSGLQSAERCALPMSRGRAWATPAIWVSRTSTGLPAR
jgi:hypothetical protein